MTQGIKLCRGLQSIFMAPQAVEGLGIPSSGIWFNTGGNLAIENCVVRNFAFAGINISPSTSSSFSVSNTIASNNGINGILVSPAGIGVALTGVLSNVTANNNGVTGISASGRSFGPQGSSSVVMLRNVVASNNSGAGLEAGGNLTILRVAHSVVTGNSIGVEALTGGIIYSYGDNDIDGNTNNNWGALTPLAKH
jgi:hypothetical protein